MLEKNKMIKNLFILLTISFWVHTTVFAGEQLNTETKFAIIKIDEEHRDKGLEDQ